MTTLPISRTEVYSGALDAYPTDANIPYGPANLSDDSDATAIRLSNLQAADWFVYFDGTSLTDADSLTLFIRLNVISRDMTEAGFVARLSLFTDGGPETYTTGTQVDVTIDIAAPDGVSEHTFVLDQAWMAANPSAVWTASGDESWVSVRDTLLSGANTPHFGLQIHGFAGSPYEVDVYKVSATVPDTGLAAPTPLTAAETTETSVRLQWGPVDGATGYRVRVNGGTPTDVGYVTSYLVSGLTPGTSYTFDVQAYADTQDSPWSTSLVNQTPDYPVRPHYQRTVRDGNGKTMVGSTVTVYQPGTTLALGEPIYDDAIGTGQRGDTWVAIDGVVDFYLGQPRVVDISVAVPGIATPIVFEDQWVGDPLGTGAGGAGVEGLPAGVVLAAFRNEVAGTWPAARPTDRTDLTVLWIGEVAPPVDLFLDGVDVWIRTVPGTI